MAPLDECNVVVVDRGGRQGVVNGVAKDRQTGDHVPSGHGEMQAQTGSPYFCFAGAEGCAFLALGFPGNGAS